MDKFILKYNYLSDYADIFQKYLWKVTVIRWKELKHFYLK